jgi:acylpyruvate hydrolase
MRIAHVGGSSGSGLAVETPEGWRSLASDDPRYPGDVLSLLRQGIDVPSLLRQGIDVLIRAHKVLREGELLDLTTVTFKPPVANPGKIICVGLNFIQHVMEGGFKPPAVPDVFARFRTSLAGAEDPLRRPRESTQFDFEGELAVVIGESARRVDKDAALDSVAGYSVFNDATLRDYQFHTGQWTLGKNFDGTGGDRTCFGHRGRAS